MTEQSRDREALIKVARLLTREFEAQQTAAKAAKPNKSLVADRATKTEPAFVASDPWAV